MLTFPTYHILSKFLSDLPVVGEHPDCQVKAEDGMPLEMWLLLLTLAYRRPGLPVKTDFEILKYKRISLLHFFSILIVI